MATASKEENSTRKAQALYVIRYQSFAILREHPVFLAEKTGSQGQPKSYGLHFSMDSFISYKLAQFLTR